MTIKKSDERRHKIQVEIFRTSQNLELIIAGVVIVGILISFLAIPGQLKALYFNNEDFNSFLKFLFNIIIGIELLKMLCRHDIDSVVEVLLFAVARGMIIEHMPIVETLIGIIAIAILFVIRKYLFVSALDKQEPEMSSAPLHLHANEDITEPECNTNDTRTDDIRTD